MTQNMLDGVQVEPAAPAGEVAELSTIVRNADYPLGDRIEALEDIMSLEIGDTRMVRARHLERERGIRQCFLKYEGDNPTGTQKDRIAFAQTLDALRRGYGTLALATCGNYGVACAYACWLAGIDCKIFLPESYHSQRIAEMERFGAEVLRLPGTYEAVVEQSSALARHQHWYDANPGGANTPIQIRAYAQIAYEIYDQLRDAPRYCACPVSNGTVLAGVYRGFVTLYKRGRTSRIPVMVAGSSAYKNPIIAARKRGLDHCPDLNPARIRETATNEALINWRSFDGAEALDALNRTNGFAAHVSDRRMKSMTTLLHQTEGMRVLPAATAGLIALLDVHESEPLKNDRFVAVLTAKQ